MHFTSILSLLCPTLSSPCPFLQRAFTIYEGTWYINMIYRRSNVSFNNPPEQEKLCSKLKCSNPVSTPLRITSSKMQVLCGSASSPLPCWWAAPLLCDRRRTQKWYPNGSQDSHEWWDKQHSKPTESKSQSCDYHYSSYIDTDATLKWKPDRRGWTTFTKDLGR